MRGGGLSESGRDQDRKQGVKSCEEAAEPAAESQDCLSGASNGGVGGWVDWGGGGGMCVVGGDLCVGSASSAAVCPGFLPATLSDTKAHKHTFLTLLFRVTEKQGGSGFSFPL